MFIANCIEILTKYGSSLLIGVRTSLLVALTGTAFGLVLGLIVGGFRAVKLDFTAGAAARFWKKLFDVIANVYITVFRGTPMMVQAVFIYYALLNVIHWDTLTAAIVVISINTGAYMAEIIRSGIQAVDPGQTEASRSLGMSNAQTELMFQAKSIAGSTYHFTETYFLEAMIYLLMTSVASIVLNIIEKRMNRTKASLSLPMSDTDPSNAPLIKRVK